eukprot:395979-Rhodomonas_salina.2
MLPKCERQKTERLIPCTVITVSCDVTSLCVSGRHWLRWRRGVRIQFSGFGNFSGRTTEFRGDRVRVGEFICFGGKGGWWREVASIKRSSRELKLSGYDAVGVLHVRGEWDEVRWGLLRTLLLCHAAKATGMAPVPPIVKTGNEHAQDQNIGLRVVSIDLGWCSVPGWMQHNVFLANRIHRHMRHKHVALHASRGSRPDSSSGAPVRPLPQPPPA